MVEFKRKCILINLTGFNAFFPNHVFNPKKALHSLKQALRVWYENLRKFLLENNFQSGKVDINLFIKKIEHVILLVPIYVNDIIFGAINEPFCK